MILNTYHTPIWIVQRLPNDAYSNCILIFSASFFPGTWPIMKRHCSSLRFGRPANQLVFQYRSPPQIRKNKLHSTLTECLSGLVVSTHSKEKQIKLDLPIPSFRARKMNQKMFEKTHDERDPPILQKKHHETTFQALSFSWICIFGAWKKIQTYSGGFFMVMKSHGGNP